MKMLRVPQSRGQIEHRVRRVGEPDITVITFDA
jgi:hypothetical protein